MKIAEWMRIHLLSLFSFVLRTYFLFFYQQIPVKKNKRNNDEMKEKRTREKKREEGERARAHVWESEYDSR